MPPPAASARGGYHQHGSSAAPRPALRRNADGTYFKTQTGSHPDGHGHKKNVVVMADEPHQHGPRKRDPVPGTPHPKSGELPRAGAVPLNTAFESIDEEDEEDSGRRTHRILSPLYKPEPHALHYDIEFWHIVPAIGPGGIAVNFEIHGLQAGMNPTTGMKDRESVFFERMTGSVFYLFQAKGYEPVRREVVLHGQGFRRSTIAAGASELVRGFYRDVSSTLSSTLPMLECLLYLAIAS